MLNIQRLVLSKQNDSGKFYLFQDVARISANSIDKFMIPVRFDLDHSEGVKIGKQLSDLLNVGFQEHDEETQLRFIYADLNEKVVIDDRGIHARFV